MITYEHVTSFDLGMIFIGGMLCGIIVATIILCGGNKKHEQEQQCEESDEQERNETLDK